MDETPAPDRLSFDDAVKYARESGKAAFVAAPVFGDDDETAEGARIFIVEGDGQGGHRIRFVAGPFFSAALAANEVLADDEVPDRVRELLFTRTTFSQDWLTDQVQVLVGRLVQAASLSAPDMPNYLDMPARAAAPEVVFPISQIGRAGPRR
jgi:hypothetical protein